MSNNLVSWFGQLVPNGFQLYAGRDFNH